MKRIKGRSKIDYIESSELFFEFTKKCRNCEQSLSRYRRFLKKEFTKVFHAEPRVGLLLTHIRIIIQYKYIIDGCILHKTDIPKNVKRNFALCMSLIDSDSYEDKFSSIFKVSFNSERHILSKRNLNKLNKEKEMPAKKKIAKKKVLTKKKVAKKKVLVKKKIAKKKVVTTASKAPSKSKEKKVPAYTYIIDLLKDRKFTDEEISEMAGAKAGKEISVGFVSRIRGEVNKGIFEDRGVKAPSELYKKIS